MRERGIIFNADMVRAVLNGSKTQTRRIIKNQPHGSNGMTWWPTAKDETTGTISGAPGVFIDTCPFGAVGDRLWVRETWSSDFANYYPNDRVWYATDNNRRLDIEVVDGVRGIYSPESDVHVPFRWRPSIHMPRWASRITLEITGVRVERLQSMSGEDARSEGFAYEDSHLLGDIDEFSRVWTSIYGEKSWQANPWVWVIEFKRVEHVGEEGNGR